MTQKGGDFTSAANRVYTVNADREGLSKYIQYIAVAHHPHQSQEHGL